MLAHLRRLAKDNYRLSLHNVQDSLYYKRILQINYILNITLLWRNSMAKMHTRRKGQAGSTKPIRSEAPVWSTMSADEINKSILEMWKQGMSTSLIGMTLRDKYGVPDVKLVTGKKITAILKENDQKPPVPEDLYNLLVKAIGLRKHVANNHSDKHNNRSLHNIEAKIRRLVKYYQASKILPADWKYKPETAEMLITR
jgi:small subunit ribosomal protein S15